MKNPDAFPAQEPEQETENPINIFRTNVRQILEDKYNRGLIDISELQRGLNIVSFLSATANPASMAERFVQTLKLKEITPKVNQSPISKEQKK